MTSLVIEPTQIRAVMQQQRDYFNAGQTRGIATRLGWLKALRRSLVAHEAELLAALHSDLHKPAFEAYAYDLGCLKEIDHAIAHLRRWAKPKWIVPSWEQWPALGQIRPEPRGVVLIVSPWNYPVLLSITPLVGAIAAGNCAIIKPSELAPATGRVLAELIRKTFDPAHVTVIEGDIATSQALLAEPWDHIFFTGGTATGKQVMAAAAAHLTPVTLELGGKSPCIVDADVDVAIAAKRIVWGKFLNAGQSCVAPDYLLVDRRIKPALIEAIATTIRQFYGDDPAHSPDYARIVSDRQMARLTALLQDGTVIIGGQTQPSDRYIAPTVIDDVALDAPIMQDEIFGPLLPVIPYDHLDEAIALVNRKPKPLALYIFSRSVEVQRQVLRRTQSGGACVNEILLHLGIPDLPFGGIGASGIGAHHGKASFDTFSHSRSILFKPFWLDAPIRYAPYGDKLWILKKIFG